MFKHSICGDQPEILDGMPNTVDPLPPEFFVNPRCPPASTTVEVKAIDVDLDEGSGGGCYYRGTEMTSFPMLVLVILGVFLQGAPFCHRCAHYFL